MSVLVSIEINAPKEKVWNVITDIENAKERISGITDIAVLEKPTSGIVGLKWEETRVMFGKEAKETMWVVDSKDNEFYETNALNCGAKYISRLSVEDTPNGCKLSMGFRGEPQTLMAKLMAPLGMFMSGMIKKALQKDLEDIKAAVEKA